MILRKGGRRVAKQGEVFQRCCRWFGASSSYGIVRGRLGVCGNCRCMDHGWHTIYADIDDMETERLYRIRLGTVEGRLENRNLASL